MLSYKILGGLMTAALGAVMTATGLDSGPKVGETLPAFEPAHVTGPDAGTDTGPVCKYGDTPAVQVWVNGGPTEEIARLTSSLDKKMAELNTKATQLKSFVMFKGEDVSNLEGKLHDLARREKLKQVSLTWVGKGSGALELYRINPEAKTTILVYKDRRLAQKFVDLNVGKNLEELDAAIEKITR